MDLRVDVFLRLPTESRGLTEVGPRAQSRESGAVLETSPAEGRRLQALVGGLPYLSHLRERWRSDQRLD